MTEKKSFLDSLYNFVSDHEGLSQAEIVSELENQGVATNQLQTRVSEVIEKGSKARRLSWLDRARQRQADIETRLKAKAPIFDASNLKAKVQEILSGSYGSQAQRYAEAYFRKKDELTDEDLQSLLEDLEDLDILTDKDQSEE